MVRLHPRPPTPETNIGEPVDGRKHLPHRSLTRWTWTWSPPPARTATSCWSRAQPGHRRPGPGRDSAVRFGASVVFNSYGLPESGAMIPWEQYYRHPGVTITVSSGDFGCGPANFPAVMPTVIAVGGTSLRRADNVRGWVEHAWSDQYDASASGCSATIAKPAGQHDPHCQMRTVATSPPTRSGPPVRRSTTPTTPPQWACPRAGRSSAGPPATAAATTCAPPSAVTMRRPAGAPRTAPERSEPAPRPTGAAPAYGPSSRRSRSITGANPSRLRTE